MQKPIAQNGSNVTVVINRVVKRSLFPRADELAAKYIGGIHSLKNYDSTIEAKSSIEKIDYIL